MHWFLLAVGVAIEIAATASLRPSDGFTRPGFTALTLMCFALAFYLMSLVVRTKPLGIAYSVWAGGSIAGATLLSANAFGQSLDGYAYLGLGLIIAGVMVLNTLSTAAGS